jgi:hypothetical protein
VSKSRLFFAKLAGLSPPLLKMLLNLPHSNLFGQIGKHHQYKRPFQTKTLQLESTLGQWLQCEALFSYAVSTTLEYYTRQVANPSRKSQFLFHVETRER